MKRRWIIAGIVIAVLLTVLTLLLRASRPHDAILGRVPGTDDYSAVAEAKQLSIGALSQQFPFRLMDWIIPAASRTLR